MPPATRREVRLSASLPDPVLQNGSSNTLESSRSASMLVPNMASILENFEQFQRKHISQNREIIKANAVAQLRIRELENRIQSLEAEKVQKQMDTIGLEAQVSRLHHAIGCIHAGWEAIGRGLTLRTGQTQSLHHSSSSQLPASNRVSIEPNPNAQLVVRSVAKAPDGHIGSLDEEEDLKKDPFAFSQHVVAASDARSRFGPAMESVHDDWKQHMDTVRAVHADDLHASRPDANNSAVSTLDMDGAPSPMGTPELPMELEGAFAAAASQPNPHSWSLPRLSGTLSTDSMPSGMQQQSAAGEFDLDHNAASDLSNRQFLRRSGRKSSRRQSGFISQQDHSDASSPIRSPNLGSPESPPVPSSEPYFPSEANSDMMDGVLVYQGCDQEPVLRYSSSEPGPAPLTDITNGISRSSSGRSDLSASHVSEQTTFADVTPRKQRQIMSEASASSHTPIIAPPSETRTPGGRKRKIPTHEPAEPMPTPAKLFGAAIAATPGSSESVDAEPQTGRTRRVRKSINYALPKLNTKMRKPDPSDLVPASTPHRTPGTAPSSAHGMVGSSGNLSDIRKLHEAAAMRQSPAERTSKMRSSVSPGRASYGRNDAGTKEEESVRMADLFEIRQHANRLAEQKTDTESRPDARHAFWAIDSVTDTSDDDSRVTSNADLGELAELEAAMSDLCTADEVHQVDTPRAPQPSAWPSRSAAQMSTSSSTDSIISGCSGSSSTGAGNKRQSLRRKTTTLPSRSRQSSVEQPLQPEIAAVSVTGSDAASSRAEVAGVQSIQKKTGSVPAAEATKASVAAQKSLPERTRPASASSTSTELGNGRPAMPSGGLAAGMKPKQRPASAGATLTGSRTASGSLTSHSSIDRPRTFSGTTAASAGLSQSSTSISLSNSVGRGAGSTSSQRTSLHSALTNQAKAMPSQMTPRVGARGLPPTNTPTFKESPRLAGTPILRPAVSTSSLASESSGRSSPGLLTASTGSSGTQLSTTTRPMLKVSAAQQSKTQRPVTSGSVSSASVSSRPSPRLNSSSTSSAGSARPQPAKSMPSLRRGTEKTGVTSTPRITVRSSSSTLPSTNNSVGNGSSASTPAASIAASKVAKAISSTSLNRSKEVSSAPMGLGIDFSSMLTEVPSGKELLNLTNEIHEVLQSSSSTTGPSSSLSSEAHSSSPTSGSRTSSNESAMSSATEAKTRRSSRRVSGLTA